MPNDFPSFMPVGVVRGGGGGGGGGQDSLGDRGKYLFPVLATRVV